MATYVVIEYSPRGKKIVFEGGPTEVVDEAFRLRQQDKEKGGKEAVAWGTCPKDVAIKELAS